MKASRRFPNISRLYTIQYGIIRNDMDVLSNKFVYIGECKCDSSWVSKTLELHSNREKPRDIRIIRGYKILFTGTCQEAINFWKEGKSMNHDEPHVYSEEDYKRKQLEHLKEISWKCCTYGNIDLKQCPYYLAQIEKLETDLKGNNHEAGIKNETKCS